MQTKEEASNPTQQKVQENMNELSKSKQKQLEHGNFKLNKKLVQGIKVICSSEQSDFEDLAISEVKSKLIVLHFGNGDEDDYIGLKSLLDNMKVTGYRINIFPGNLYGLIEFKSNEDSFNVMSNLLRNKENPLVSTIEIQFGMKKRHVIFCYSNRELNQFKRGIDTNFPVAITTDSIPGLQILREYVSEIQEQKLFEELDKQQWIKLANRRVQHYGYEFIYGLNSIDKNKKVGELPEFVQEILVKIHEIPGIKQQGYFDQLTVNNYQPGEGIPPHFDTHSPFEEYFVALSIGSGVVMSFRSYQNEQKHLYLPRRSLIVFSGEARYAWQHSIAQRKLDKVDNELSFRRRRISLTFRRIKMDPCKCNFAFYCDSQGYDPVKTKQTTDKNVKDKKIKEEEVKINDYVTNQQNINDNHIKPGELEKKYVYDVYDKIAPHFSHTRYKPWPKVEKFINSLDKGTIIADVGCGNGKYFGINEGNVFSIGTDRSQGLIELAKARDISFQVFSADSLRLPMRNQCVDVILSIAVIHHFSTKALRIQAISELNRILRVGGIMFIQVWALEQDERKFEHQDVFVPWHLQYKYEESEESITESIKDRDVINDEERKNVVYKRYYHVFLKGELEQIIQEFNNLQVEESFYDHANWGVIVRKTKEL